MNNFKKYTYCPICKSEKIKQKYTDVLSQDKKNFNIFECDDCRLQFVAEKLSPEYIENFYCKVKDTSEHTYSDENIENLNYYYKSLKKYIETNFIQKGKILDIGCSSGYFLDIMDGWERYGVEISTKYAEIAKQKYKDKIFTGSIADYTWQENFFDVITLQDSLDHMLNPVDIIKKCNYLLKPNGILVIKVHNMDCLYAKLSGKNFYAFIPPEHLFYFNKKSLSCLLNLNGFRAVSFNYFAHMLKLKTIFLRLSHSVENSIYYKIYKYMKERKIGDIKFKKNLHDIVTVFAKKEI